MARPEQRFDYSALPQRDKWSLPNGAKVAVYCIVNIEEWNIERPIAREYVSSPEGMVTVPNVPNWAWHEYGMRVGIWRIMEALEKRNLKAAAAVNACVCEGAGEPVVRALLDADWEFMGHGYHQAIMNTVEDQYDSIRKSYALLSAYTGKDPKGWVGPGLHETMETLDYLAAAGFKYTCDWPMDDMPVQMGTTTNPLVAMPYSLELSDLPMMAVHHHQSQVWQDRVKDQFDRLYAEGATQPRVMSMSLHPNIMGVPHRIKHFEAALDHIIKNEDVWFATPGEIYDWYANGQGNQS